MIIIRTSGGQTFEIEWAGVASIDGVLRFSIINANIKDIIDVFSVPENCETLTRVFDNNEQTFEGYTVFRGVQINYNNSCIVSMSKI